MYPAKKDANAVRLRHQSPYLPEPKVYQKGFDLLKNSRLTKVHQNVFVSAVLLYNREVWASSLIFHGQTDNAKDPWTNASERLMTK